MPPAQLMKCHARRRTQLSAALVLVWLALPSSLARARPLDSRCATVHIEAPKALPERWARAVDELCAVLAERDDLDPAASLRLALQPDGSLALRLTIKDGRQAERNARSTATLARSVEALLVLPEGSPPPPVPETAEPPLPEPGPRPSEAASAEAKIPSSNLHVKLGASVIGHVAGVPAYIGGGFSLQAGLRFYSVFFEIAPQWEAQQVSARERLPDFEMHNFGVSGVLGLRIWDTPEGAAEIALGALILMEDQTYTPQDHEIGGTLIDGEITAFARLLWGQSSFRWSVRSDVIIAPARLSHEAHIRDIFPALPSFAVGVSFGLHWEST